MTFKEIFTNAKPFLILMHRWITDRSPADISTTLKINGHNETFTVPNAIKASTGYAQLASRNGSKVYEISNFNDLNSICRAAPIGGSLEFRATSDIKITSNLVLFQNVSIDLDGHKLTFGTDGNNNPYNIRTSEHSRPLLLVKNGEVYSSDKVPASIANTCIIGWMADLRVVFMDVDVYLRKSSILNQHSTGHISFVMLRGSINKAGAYEENTNVVQGSYGSYNLRLAAVTYNNNLTKDDVFHGTYIE